MSLKYCRNVGLVFVMLGLAQACARPEAPPAKATVGGVDRTVLPIHEPAVAAITELDARNATAPPRFAVTAPKGAPNVVIVLIDDIGFGASSSFGGPINMPTLEKLAGAGLRYNRFHTTALCSPTRVALLTGRNHHVNNAGAIMELATGSPGNTGIRPNSVTPLAQILRLNGFSTAAFGRYHETPPGKSRSVGALRSLADRLRVRQVLRLHRRRDQPVGPVDLRRRHARPARAVPDVPLHDGHDDAGDQMGERPALADAGEAVLHVLRPQV